MSSDIEAWFLTDGFNTFCKATASNFPLATYPKGEMRWGLCATAGALHWIHVDADGLGTFVDMRCGGKWWLLFTPPVGQSQMEAFGRVDHLRDFDVKNLDIGWLVEAVYLTPGTRL